MASAIAPSTWENGFQQPSTGTPWVWKPDGSDATEEDTKEYVTAPSKEVVTSTVHNQLGINVLRTWPTLFDGTNNPHGTPSWWKPSKEVDVLIIGAGPSGLEVAASLARQGVSFRIIDKADSPLDAGRADGVQPRFLETLAMWGMAPEVHEEGPLIERTAIYKDGKKLLFQRSHQSDSRYRGLHIITQGQVERIFIRDLARHKVLVERSSVLTDFKVEPGQHDNTKYPIHATIRNERSGTEQEVHAKYLVGSDGASSGIRKSLGIPFDGVSTDIYWGIMDCIYTSDYPHAWVFGSVISSKHGGCVIIPRENGNIRLYTQLDVSQTGPIATSRQANDASFAESGGKVDIHSITPEEVLEQANKIFAPYKLEFAAPLSWFAIWKISERVARSYSSPDQRVHLVGDAAHVHSVMGAFGLNASILDASNLAWKVGLAAKGLAKSEALLSTYNQERRKHGVRIIQVSGTYLRFVCGSALPVPDFDQIDKIEGLMQQSNGTGVNGHDNSEVLVQHIQNSEEAKASSDEALGKVPDHKKDLELLGGFFKAHGQFLLGVDCGYDESIVSPTSQDWDKRPRALGVKNGVRAPNPRVCFRTEETGYLYDKLAGAPRFHLVIFGSSLTGRGVRRQASTLAESLHSPTGFYHRFGGAQLFNVVLVIKLLPFEYEERLAAQAELQSLAKLGAQVVFDDRAPDDDAHTTWGADHARGGVAVIRPDLWIGTTVFPGEVAKLSGYFEAFLQKA